MATRQARTFCRICSGNCGMVLTIDEASSEIISIRGDKDQPMTRGYACFKGLQAEEAHHGPSRLLKPLKRQSDGSFIPIDSEQALDEIAERLRVIIDREGSDAVALFNGTQGLSIATYQMNFAFMAAIASDQLYSTLTIDQSAKIVSFERQGAWAAGLQDLSQSEVVLFFGANPLLSHITVPVMGPDPTRSLKRAKARGLKLICIDPRRTETARHADLFLQPVPGRDAAIAAGMIRMILEEGWEDRDFVHQHVGEGSIASLRAAVKPFTEEKVERCASLMAGQLRAATQLFARDSRSGAAYASTGPSMAPFSNLMQHLVETLNIVCGRFRRAGDRAVTDMIVSDHLLHAEVIAPPRSWESLPPGRIRGVGRLGGERLTATLPEEILTPGKGQVRALIVDGGNPASSVPDQRRMVEAMKSLDLLVVVDPYMSATAQLADYILPPRMQFERADLPVSVPGFPLYPVSWAQYAPAALCAPAGSDVVEDWYVFWALAKRLGVVMIYNGVALDMATAPSTDDLFAIRLANSRVSLDELKQYPSGKVFDIPSAIVRPARPGAEAKFDVMPADVGGEVLSLLRSMESDGSRPLAGFTHFLTTRRMRDVHNSTGSTLSAILRRAPYNPAYMNPLDLLELGLECGDRVEVASEHGRLEAIVQADNDVRSGVVSMAHAWGGLPDQKGPGVNVNLLISCDTHVENVNAMPRMSAIPINISRLKPSSTDQVINKTRMG